MAKVKALTQNTAQFFHQQRWRALFVVHCDESKQQSLTPLDGDWLAQLVKPFQRDQRAGLWLSLTAVENTAALAPLGEDLVVASGKHSESLLGQEFSWVIMDARNDFNCDQLAAISGSVRAGGVLVLLWPSPRKCSTVLPHQQRLLGVTQPYSSWFLDYFTQAMTAPEVAHFALGDDKPSAMPQFPDKQPKVAQPKAEQIAAVAAIVRVFTGHAKRHLVLTSDRGRGKSSALGMAAAELAQTRQKRLVITAPSQHCVQQVMHWWHQNTPSDLHHLLRFFAVDEVHRALQGNGLLLDGEPIDGLLVDEAAAIPAFILRDLVEHFNRIVFATTVQGYEGSGRGFALRFLPFLMHQAPQSRVMQLQHPIRWALNDPLENWVNQTFLLSHHQTDVDCAPSTPLTLHHLAPGATLPVTMLRKIFLLLVDSHYQTTPNDLWQLMDHPQRHVFYLTDAIDTVVAVAVVIAEGALPEALAAAVQFGQRRARGHLVAQALTLHLQQPQWCTDLSWRIQRIAVLASERRKGHGLALLSAIRQAAEAANVTYLSSSFGLTAELIRFWQQAGFQLSRVGITRDKTSGCHSVMLVRILTEAPALVASMSELFARIRILLRRELKSIKAHDVVALMPCLPKTKGIKSPEVYLPSLAARLNLMHEHRLPLADFALEVQRLMMCVAEHPQLLSDAGASAELALLVAYYWQTKSLEELQIEFKVTGQKQLQSRLAAAVKHLLDWISE